MPVLIKCWKFPDSIEIPPIAFSSLLEDDIDSGSPGESGGFTTQDIKHASSHNNKISESAPLFFRTSEMGCILMRQAHLV